MKTKTTLAGLRHRRLARGMTQQQLADGVGLRRASVAMWETGRGMPSAALLPELAVALSCSIDELFEPAPEDTLPPEGEDDHAGELP